jgi:hypothetical protein
MVRYSRLIAVAILLWGCPDPDPEPADMRPDADRVDMALDGSPPPDAGPSDMATPPDRGVDMADPPDMGRPHPAERTPSVEICAGCGVARSADFTAIQRVVPFRHRRATSSDFTMELMTAPAPTENAR